MQALVCFGEAEGLVSEGIRVLLQLADESVAVGAAGRHSYHPKRKRGKKR